jgi:hypothetical protein
MKTPELQTTSKYDLFVSYEYQREIHPAHVAKLVASMKAHGFLPSKPLQVYRGDGKLHLLDGHHRLNAAKALGIPVFYVIETERSEETVGAENMTVRRWVPSDFLGLFAGKGNEHYQTLAKYNDLGFPLKQAASLLIGESAHSGNVSNAVASGTFRVKTTWYCDIIVGIWHHSDGVQRVVDACPCIKGRTFIEALSMLLRVDPFEPEVMAKRILGNPRMVTKCADRLQALDMLDEIYNFRAKIKLPLAHLAKEAMRDRNVGSKSAK